MEESGASAASSVAQCHILPLGRRLAYSVGHVLNDLCATMWFTYLLIYQQSVLRFSKTIAGGLLLLGQVADALATPFVGLESDRHDDFWLCKYGRRKTWHLVGTICVALTFPFLFTKCIDCSESSQEAQFAYYGAFIIIFQFGWAATQVSHLSLIPDLTPFSSERVELNAYRYAMTVMSNICVYGTVWLVFGTNDNKESHVSPKDAGVFQNVSLSVVGVGLVFSIVFHVFVKENPSTSHVNQLIINSVDEGKPHLRWKDWFKQPQFYMVATLYMATRLFINLFQVYMPLYIQYALNLHKDNIAIIPLVIYVSSFTTTFVIKYLNVTLGNKITYFIGCILGLTSCVWIYVGGESDSFRFQQIFAVAVLIGMAGSTLLIISLSFTSDLIANSITSGAFVFGSMSFVDKLANGVAVIIIQDLHPCKTCACQSCDLYYQRVLVFACGGAICVGLIALMMLLTQTIGVRHNEHLIPRLSINSRSCSIVDAQRVDDIKPLLLTEEMSEDDENSEHLLNHVE